MAIKREDFGLGDENQEQYDDLQKEDNQKEEELKAEREARHKAEIEAAAAKGEAEALKRGIPPPQENKVVPWTDDQWEAEGQKRGFSGPQFKAIAEAAGGISHFYQKQSSEEIASAKREAAEAREEARKARSGTSLYAIEKEFYDKNPGLVGHKGDVAEFMSLIPAEVKEDPKRYADALEKAKTFVRGKARESLENKRSGKQNLSRQTSERREYLEDTNEEDNRTEEELDTSDLDNEGARRLVESLHRQPGGEDLSDGPPALDELNINKAFEVSQRADKRGVAIDERGEFARGARQLKRSLSDPSRPARLRDEDRDRRENTRDNFRGRR